MKNIRTTEALTGKRAKKPQKLKRGYLLLLRLLDFPGEGCLGTRPPFP